ncbi:MAG: FUSC family protein, partial [Pseudomonadota bacterium]|nr:FUSC family protein [Pseudomonadota bacterium]
MSALESRQMPALTPRAKEAIKTALAMTIAYGVALSMDWDNPHWAGFAVAFISLSTVGQSLNKGAMRLLGTLLAAVFSLTLIALFPQERWWFFLVLSAFVGVCTYMMGGARHQYFWNVAGFVSLIVCMSSVPATDNAFDVAVLRILETGLGILVYTLVTVLVWPTGTCEELDAALRRLAATQHELYRQYRRLLHGQGAAVDTWPLRMQEVQELSQFSQALSAARTDSYEVWEVRRQWQQVQDLSAQVMENLERWRESFTEVQDLDMTKLLPHLEVLGEELDDRFGQIERMLVDEAPERLPRDVELALNQDAARALSHFQKAALAVTRTRLQHLDALTRSLFDVLADIKGFEMASPQPLGNAAPQPRFVFDLDRMAAAARVMAGLWLAYVAWIYTQIPGGTAFVIMAGPIGMALATM